MDHLLSNTNKSSNKVIKLKITLPVIYVSAVGKLMINMVLMKKFCMFPSQVLNVKISLIPTMLFCRNFLSGGEES